MLRGMLKLSVADQSGIPFVRNRGWPYSRFTQQCHYLLSWHIPQPTAVTAAVH